MRSLLSPERSRSSPSLFTPFFVENKRSRAFAVNPMREYLTHLVCPAFRLVRSSKNASTVERPGGLVYWVHGRIFALSAAKKSITSLVRSCLLFWHVGAWKGTRESAFEDALSGDHGSVVSGNEREKRTAFFPPHLPFPEKRRKRIKC